MTAVSRTAPNLAPQPHHHALLASRLFGLDDLRRRIWTQGQRSGMPVWVSEIDAHDQFADKNLDYIQVACLRQVRSAPKFFCLIDGSFGTTWNEGQVSILELELATAAFSKRDIWIFLLAPYDRPDPRIENLLKAIAIAIPNASDRIRGPLTKIRCWPTSRSCWSRSGRGPRHCASAHSSRTSRASARQR